MKVVIDFSSYLQNNEFIIKEFCMYFVSGIQVVRDCLIVTKTVNSNDPQNIADYEDYYAYYGIPRDNQNFSDINILRNKIAGSLDVNQKIYVRDNLLVDILTEFVGIKYNNIKCLEDMGFDCVPLKRTDCPYHDNQLENYCAGDNALLMVNCLLQKTLTKIQSRRHMQVIVNFNGYYNGDNNKFIFKELCVYGLNAAGSIIYRKLYVTEPPSYIFNSANTIDHYNQFLYENYGIKWTAGTYKPSQINNRLNNILRKAAVKYIFVQNYQYKNILSTIIENFASYDFITLDEIVCEGKSPEQTICSFHTHPVVEKNVCMENYNKDMAVNIQNMKLYQDKMKNALKRLNEQS